MNNCMCKKKKKKNAKDPKYCKELVATEGGGKVVATYENKGRSVRTDEETLAFPDFVQEKQTLALN